MKAQLRKVIPAMLALFTLNAPAVTRYVDLNSPNPTPPYTSWLTAATNIQVAIDVATVGDLVLVTNGIYESGNVSSSRVNINKAITVRSVSGPVATIIKGYQTPGVTNGPSSVRCAYLVNGAVLSGFTLTNGSTTPASVGGGVYCSATNAVVTNCVIRGNSSTTAGGIYTGTAINCILDGNRASNSGGGAFDSTLINCIISNNSAESGGGSYRGYLTNCAICGNQATSSGGGAFFGSLSHCTIIGNSASVEGGGTYHNNNNLSRLVNSCIIYYNTAPSGPNYASINDNNLLKYCCSAPLPPTGVGNISNAPVFVDTNGWGNLHLQSNSPCINAGRNPCASNSTDLEGNPRIVGGTADIGAYEFQTPGSVLSYAWAQQNGLATDGTADYADSDTDGANNWQEWRADTIPTNVLSALRMITTSNAAAGVNVTWQSVSTRNYFLERATNFGAVPPFQAIATNIAGVSGTKTYTDLSATNGGPYFYRVGVQ